MHRMLLLFLLIATAALGCRGSNEPAHTDNTPDNGPGAVPPPPVLADDGNTSTTVLGQVVDPTVEYTTQREIVGEMNMPELIKALGDEKLAPSAADELATRGDQSVQPLTEALDSKNDRIKQQAIFTLGLLGPLAKGALPKLQAIAEDSDNEVQSDAAKFAMDAIEGK